MLKKITISPKKQVSLDRISDFLIDNHSDLIDRLENFELIAGKSSFLGDGSAPVKRIIITAIIEKPDENSEKDIHEILAILKEKADELNIELDIDES